MQLNNGMRYTIDRIGEFEWVLFDTNQRNSPITYFLFLTHVDISLCNYQLTLTSYNAVDAATLPYPIFSKEIFSTQFYSVKEGIDIMVDKVYRCLQNCDIENPIELVYSFGGRVNSKLIPTPPLSWSH